jgi:hypothetical protein
MKPGLRGEGLTTVVGYATSLASIKNLPIRVVEKIRVRSGCPGRSPDQVDRAFLDSYHDAD